MPKDASRNYYAVRRGRQVGIYQTWAECNEQVNGFSNPAFRKFGSRKEAEEFINSAASGLPQHGQPYTKRDYSSNNKGTAIHTGKNRPTHAVVLSTTTSSNHAVSLSSKIPFASVTDAEEVVYTDGASSGNGKKDAKAGWGIFWGGSDPRNGGGSLPGERQTNQRAELYAIVRALEMTITDKTTLEIRTDSQYAINCIDKWSEKWIKNGWKATGSGKKVENRDLVERVLDLRELRPGKVFFSYVPGHSGVYGNEMADKLAVQGAAGLR